jgi:hypothetical protein
MPSQKLPWNEARTNADETQRGPIEMAGGIHLAARELRWPAELRSVYGIPIAAGENSSTLMDFERLMALRIGSLPKTLRSIF